jgi:glycosyltransferase involved in cell wall biosynthesis
MRAIVVMPLAEQRGGAEVMLKQLAHSQSQIEWHIVFLEDGPMVSDCRARGTKTYVVEAGRLRHPLRYIQTIRRLANLVQHVKAEAILSWMGKGHLYGGMAARLANVPAVWYQLGLPADIHWLDRLATLIPADCVVTCSQAGARAQASLWPHRRTAVVHPGVDIDQFRGSAPPSRTAARQHLGIPEDRQIVLIDGRLQRWKGMHVFIEAMAHVSNERGSVQGIIVGGRHDLEPDYPDILRRQIQELNLDEHVEMVGFQRNVADWMTAADVFVHASDREPFGIVVIEALALGTPVVATDTAGPTEVIKDGETGFLTPFGNAQVLADRIEHYLSNPETACSIGKAGAVRSQKFTVDRYVKELTQVILNVAEKEKMYPSASGRIPEFSFKQPSTTAN